MSESSFRRFLFPVAFVVFTLSSAVNAFAVSAEDAYPFDSSVDEVTKKPQEQSKRPIEIARLREDKLSTEVIKNGYVPTLMRLVKSNIIYKGDLDVGGDPSATFRVRLFPDGEVLSVTKTKASGILEYDAAVEKAIYYSSPFPKKSDGTLVRDLEFVFHLKR